MSAAFFFKDYEDSEGYRLLLYEMYACDASNYNKVGSSISIPSFVSVQMDVNFLWEKYIFLLFQLRHIFTYLLLPIFLKESMLVFYCSSLTAHLQKSMISYYRKPTFKARFTRTSIGS